MPQAATPPPAPFIVGVGRSGTTLLRLMLDAHPEMAIPSETHFVPALIQAVEATPDPAAALEVLRQAQTWPNLGLDLAEVGEAFAALRPFSPGAAVRAVFRLYAARQGKARWGDKTPPYRAHMAQIAHALPEARFIHIVRDGRDVALSYRGLWFGPGDDLEAQARFWVAEITRARAQAERLTHYIELRFEDLIANPEAELSRLCGALDLPFDPAMLDYPTRAKGRLAEYVQSFGLKDTDEVALDRFLDIHTRTQTPPDLQRAGRWKTEMSPDDLRRYHAIAGATLNALGYPSDA